MQNANVKICLQKIPGFRVLCDYYDVKAWRLFNMIWDALFVFLFLCPIITHEPFDRFAANFDWELGTTMGTVLAW